LAALVYSPKRGDCICRRNHKQVTFKEETNYPFDETIKFSLHKQKKGAVTFPLSLRIPEWCAKAAIKINGKAYKQADGNQVVQIDRTWQNGDVVELTLPMHIFNKIRMVRKLGVYRARANCVCA
jgi:DUF1680 family protein